MKKWKTEWKINLIVIANPDWDDRSKDWFE